MFKRFVALGLVMAFGVSLQAQGLTDKQRSLAGRYAQLEQILLRLSETSGSSNPQQATLLRKALLESKDKLLVQRFESLINILERRQLSDAVTGQTEIEQDLVLLLKLLESASRDDKREQEKEKIKEFLKDLEEILHRERILKNQTQQREPQNLPTLEKDQRDIRSQTETLRDRIAEYEGVMPQRENESENSSEGSGQEQNPSEQQQNQSNQEQNPSEQEQNQSAQEQNQSNQEQNPSRQEQNPSEQEQNQSSQEQQQEQSRQEQTPSQRALQRAMERMRQAEQKLEQAEKEGALEEQEEAIAELQRLKEELEKILRQLREEELMQTLEKLEARFKRMLQQEQTIRSMTEKLIGEMEGEPALEQRQIKIRADRLGADQHAVVEDAEAALLLLREDGTAQAMVESLLQARFDMTEAKKRLDQTTLDAITLHIEDAVIEALQEMLNAVQAAMDEARQRQENAENQEQQQDGEAEEEPLIQLLAELRMIRSMQRRVNERTTRYDAEIQRVLEKPDADLSPFKQAVEELARQQNRISRILHELKIGRIQ